MSKLRKSAQGRDCTIRIPGVCNGNPETTVLAHLSGGGMGAKRPDIFGAYACSDCHDAVDGRAKPMWQGSGINKLDVKLWFYEGVFSTQKIMLQEGLIKI